MAVGSRVGDGDELCHWWCKCNRKELATAIASSSRGAHARTEMQEADQKCTKVPLAAVTRSTLLPSDQPHSSARSGTGQAESAGINERRSEWRRPEAATATCTFQTLHFQHSQMSGDHFSDDCFQVLSRYAGHVKYDIEGGKCRGKNLEVPRPLLSFLVQEMTTDGSRGTIHRLLRATEELQAIPPSDSPLGFL